MFLSSFHNFSLPDLINITSSNSSSVSSASTASIQWDVGLILLLTVLGLFAVSICSIVLNSGKNLQHSKVDRVGYKKYLLLTFCSWDYCIKDVDAQDLKFAEIRRRMLTELRLDSEEKDSSSRSLRQKILLYGLRIIINLLSIAALVGSFVAINLVTKLSLELDFRDYDISKGFNDSAVRTVEMMITFLPAVAITVINFVVPFIFDYLVTLEHYKLEREVQVTLYRRVVLRIISLLFLLYTFYISVSNERDWCGRVKCSENEKCKPMDCWEQIFGSQLYKLVLIDFVALLIASVVQILKHFFAKCGGLARFLAPVFDIPNNVLDLIYTQILCWLGLLFCPIIPIMTCVKFVIAFYVKRSMLTRKIFEPTRKMYRADRMAAFFQNLLLITFFVSSVPVLISIFELQPSRSCGPFRVYSTEQDYQMFDSVVYYFFGLGELQKSIFILVFGQLTGIVVIILLALLWYYYRTKDNAYEAAEEMLHEMTAREEDKCNVLLRKARQLQVVFAKDNRQFYI